MEASPMSLFEKFIKEAFGSQYVIPVYQRNYTWKKNKQVKQLLDDVEKIIKGESNRHFIGSIVYVIVKTDFMVRERAVVDGQQRLITMFLIVHALRNLAIEINQDDIANQLTSNYLENINETGEYKFRLRTSVSDDDVYAFIAKRNIDEISNTSSQIYINYLYLYEELKKLIGQYGFMGVINAIKELYIVRIELDEGDNAQQIFESINSTGEKLTSADLIRNFIMMNKSNQEQEEIYQKYWLKMEKLFKESRKLEEFFRFYLATQKYSLATIKDLYEEFKFFWNEQIKVTGEKDELLKILTYARHFNRLYFVINNDELGQPLEDFRKLKTYMPATFMMEILELNRIGKITSAQTYEVLALINTYLIRRYLAGQDTSAISRFFPSYLKNVLSKINEIGYQYTVDVCKYYLVEDTKQKAMFMPDNKYIMQYLSAANAYALTNIDWILKKIETNKNPIPIDTSVLSIEHIMPQKSNDYWDQVTNLEKDEYQTLVNKLGNLTLAAKTDNSAMGNKDFEHKKFVFEQSKHLVINNAILAADKWTEEHIKNRTNAVANEILSIFHYDKPTIAILTDEEERKIFLNAKEIHVEGFLHPNNKITVFANSNIRYQTLPNSKSLIELREELLEKEFVIEENGVYKFLEDYIFNSPSTAADFILGGSNNGWDCWKNDVGIRINDCMRDTNKGGK